MKRLVLSLGILAAAACESGPEDVPPAEAKFVTNDCALLTAIGRDQYKLSRDDAKMTVRLNGEDAPWRPGCDWAAEGFNLVEVSGPEGEAATQGMSRITFNRPHYDAEGAQVRTAITRGTETAFALCRLARNDAVWSVANCGPDPRLTQPRAAAPSVADQTPEGKVVVPLDRPLPTRDATIPDPDPSSPRGSN